MDVQRLVAALALATAVVLPTEALAATSSARVARPLSPETVASAVGCGTSAPAAAGNVRDGIGISSAARATPAGITYSPVIAARWLAAPRAMSIDADGCPTTGSGGASTPTGTAASASASTSSASSTTAQSGAASTTSSAAGSSTAGASAGGAAVPAGPLAYGIHAGAQWYAAWEDPTEYLDRVATTGVKAIREDFRFDLIEKIRGTFDWTRYDRLYAATAKRGFTVLPVIDELPAWNDGAPYPAADTFAPYVAAAVKRYGPNGTFWAAHPELPKAGASEYWELWNEPYEPFSSHNAPDPAAYARLAKASVVAGRQANPAAKYLLEATYKTYAGRSWVDGMYAAVPDLNDYFDGVAVHAYGNDLDNVDGQFRRTMEEIRASFVAKGASAKPFHVTETGWSTCSNGTIYCVSEARQAVLLAGVVQRMRTTYASYVRSMYIFGYHDADGHELDPNNSEDHFGVAHTNGAPKPAMTVLQGLLA